MCKLLKIDEPTIASKIFKLHVNIEKLISVKKQKIKSKVQTYDIRDCEEYNGILELEQLLRRTGKAQAINVDDIRRSTSNAYVMGSSFTNRVEARRKDSLDSLVISEIEEKESADDLSDGEGTANKNDRSNLHLISRFTASHDKREFNNHSELVPRTRSDQPLEAPPTTGLRRHHPKFTSALEEEKEDSAFLSLSSLQYMGPDTLQAEKGKAAGLEGLVEAEAVDYSSKKNIVMPRFGGYIAEEAEE